MRAEVLIHYWAGPDYDDTHKEVVEGADFEEIDANIRKEWGGDLIAYCIMAADTNTIKTGD